MLHDDRVLTANTASAEASVWQGLDHDRFRADVVALQRASHEVPCDPKVHDRGEWHNSRIRLDDPSRLLPFEVEQRVADDLAFLAAAEEGVKAVSAVALEESLDPVGLVIRLAANGAVPQKIPDTFRPIFDLLGRCAMRKLSRKTCEVDIFELVITLSEERLHGRLQSAHWIRPQHLRNMPKKPLYRELREVSRELSNRLPSSRKKSSLLIQKLDDLCNWYHRMDKSRATRGQLMEVVRKSYELCTSDGRSTFEETIRNYGLEPRLVKLDRRIQQVNKIGRYWGLCVHLTKHSREYGEIFRNLSLKILTPYEGIKSSISFKEGRQVSCFVHAEIQLVTFYGLNPNIGTKRPRILGVSKAACYLCSLFLLIQGQYFITQSHGHLYDQWNVPDLASYEPNQVNEYRHVLAMMGKRIREDLLGARKGRRNRRYPLTSSVNLPKDRKTSISPLSSDMRTLMSEGSSNPDHNSIAQNPVQSLALPIETGRPLNRSSTIGHESSPSPYHLPSPLVKQRVAQPSAPGPVISNCLAKSPQISVIPPPPPIPKSMNSFSRDSAISTMPDLSPTTSAHHIPLAPIPPSLHAEPEPTGNRSIGLKAPTDPTQPSTVGSPPINWLHHLAPPPPKVESPTSSAADPLAQLPTVPSQFRVSSPILFSAPKALSRSSTTISSHQFPALRDISHTSSVRVSSGKISTEIEFEGPGQGRVLVQSIRNPSLKTHATFVDVGTLLPNEPLRLEQAENDDQFVLILQNRSHCLRIDMRWH